MQKCIDCGKEIWYGSIRCKSCARIFQYATRPETHPMKDKIHSEFTKLKMSLSKSGENNIQYKDGRTLKKYYCKDCSIEVSDYRIKRCSSCASIYNIKINPYLIERMIGENNLNWNGGSSLEIYPSKFNDSLKESIRKRDNYACQICGMTEEEHLIVLGKVLSVHHIDYNKENCEKNNLITTCNSCNIRANYNRDYWFKILKDKVTSMVKNKIM